MKYLVFLVIAVMFAGGAYAANQVYSPFPQQDATTNVAPKKVYHHHQLAVHHQVKPAARPRPRYGSGKPPVKVHHQSALHRVRTVAMQVSIPGIVGTVMAYVPVVNMYVQRGFEPIYDYMTVQDPVYNPALRDAGGGGGGG